MQNNRELYIKIAFRENSQKIPKKFWQCPLPPTGMLYVHTAY